MKVLGYLHRAKVKIVLILPLLTLVSVVSGGRRTYQNILKSSGILISSLSIITSYCESLQHIFKRIPFFFSN